MVGVLFRGSLTFERCILGCLEDSLLSGVRSVIDDFWGDAFIRFVANHAWSWSMYGCKALMALFMVVPCAVIVRSSA